MIFKYDRDELINSLTRCSFGKIKMDLQYACSQIGIIDIYTQSNKYKMFLSAGTKFNDVKCKNANQNQ